MQRVFLVHFALGVIFMGCVGGAVLAVASQPDSQHKSEYRMALDESYCLRDLEQFLTYAQELRTELRQCPVSKERAESLDAEWNRWTKRYRINLEDHDAYIRGFKFDVVAPDGYQPLKTKENYKVFE